MAPAFIGSPSCEPFNGIDRTTTGTTGAGEREARRRRRGMIGETMRSPILTALLVLGCNSSSGGTPQDCAAAGGQCVLPTLACVKQGPSDTCNCDPECNPGGAYCCLAFIDAGEAGSGD
jgi:hypothetical protein